MFCIRAAYSAGTSTAPLLMSSMMSCGGRPSIVHPMFWAVPRISLHVPLSSRAIERGRSVRAIARMSSKVMLPLCLTGREEARGDLATRAGGRAGARRLTVLDLLPVTWWLLEGSDDERRGRRDDGDGGLSVLDGQADCDFQSLPFGCGLGDVITDFLRRLSVSEGKLKLDRFVHSADCRSSAYQSQWTDFRGQR